MDHPVVQCDWAFFLEVRSFDVAPPAALGAVWNVVLVLLFHVREFQAHLKAHMPQIVGVCEIEASFLQGNGLIY